jgi:succinyl-CoA synthetase beta subunit
MADDINVPIIVRLQGTNSELAKKNNWQLKSKGWKCNFI